MTRTPAPRGPSYRHFTRAYARIATAIAIAGGLLAANAAGCGSEDGIVGGDCAAGFTQCTLTCVDLQTDPSNCGACGHACPPDVACMGGMCDQSSLDGSVLDDGALPDGEYYLEDGRIAFCDANSDSLECHRRDSGNNGGDGSGLGDGSGDGSGSGGDGSNAGGDGSSSGGGDGSSSGGDGSSNGDGEASYPDGCAPPFDTPQNCGSCGNVCSDDAGVCQLVDGGFECEPLCTAPLTDCSGSCVNLSRDPKNCGACGHVCPSGYCFLASCQGIVAGNIMIIGHDFKSTQPSDQQALLLTNSVFYNYNPLEAETVVLLSFEEYADPAAVANGISLLKATGEPLTVTHVTDDTTFTSDTQLTTASAVIVWDQPSAPAGALGALGTSWGPHLTTYVEGGGIVIVLDGNQGSVQEMPQLITNAGLLNVTQHASLGAGSIANVPLPGIGIARGMAYNLYVVDANTAWFMTTEPASANTLYIANVAQDAGPIELLAVQKIIN